MQLLDDVKNLIDQNGRKTHGRLVQHHELRVAHKGAGHGQHLLLAAGKGPRNLLATLFQTGEVGEHRLQIFLGHILFDVSAHFQIFLNRHLLENPPSFRDVRQTGTQKLIGFHMGDILIAEVDGAAAGMHQAGNRLQDGGLARAVCADQRHDLALADFKGHALHRVDSAVIHVHVFNFQHLLSPPLCQGMPR